MTNHPTVYLLCLVYAIMQSASAIAMVHNPSSEMCAAHKFKLAPAFSHILRPPHLSARTSAASKSQFRPRLSVARQTGTFFFSGQASTFGDIVHAWCSGRDGFNRFSSLSSHVHGDLETAAKDGERDDSTTLEEGREDDGSIEKRKGDEVGSITSMMGKKTLGVDYGLKRTGCCISVGYAPRPLPLIQHDNEPSLVASEIAKYAQREGAEQIVVGFPLNTRGEEGEQANSTRTMVNILVEKAAQCGIFLWDERFSTAIAKEKLQDAGYNSFQMKGMVDVMASIGILQDFFEKNGVGAEVVHKAQRVVQEVSSKEGAAPQQSFKEWQAQMRQQAQVAGEAGGGSQRKKKKSRKK